MTPRDQKQSIKSTTSLNYSRLFVVRSSPHTQVYVAQDDLGQQVLVKAVKRSNPTRDRFQLLRRANQVPGKALRLSTEQSIRKEIAIMKVCHHNNHVQLIEVVDEPQRDKVYIVMEYLQGGKVQWRDRETSQPLLTVNQTRRIFRDVLLGIEYCHYLGIIHRDIKPENLIWTEDRKTVKIIDYGVSHFSPKLRRVPFARWRKALLPLNDASLFPPGDLQKLRGTDYFMAPELVGTYESASPTTSVERTSAYSLSSASLPDPQSGRYSHASEYATQPITGRPKVSQQVDIWSLSVCLYCFLFGRFPFEVPPSSNQHANHAKFSLYREIATRDWDVPDTMGADRVITDGRYPKDSKSVVRLLDRMFHKDPKRRITLYEVKRHTWTLGDLCDPQQWLRATDPSLKFTPPPLHWLHGKIKQLFCFN